MKTLKFLAASAAAAVAMAASADPEVTEGYNGAESGDPNVVWNTDGEMFVYENFGRAARLTVNYETAEPLTNFPVLVKLAANAPAGFSYADFYNAAGSDLVFVDDAGNVIPHEIDTWDTAGTSLVWVKVPVVTNNTSFTMCYRSAKDGSTLAIAGVWDDYTGVWHLGETGNGVQDILDSTTNGLDMVSHANSSAESAGPVGGARRISTKTGASDANGRVFLDLSQDAVKKAKVDDLGTTFVASYWIKLAGNCDWSYPIGRKASDKNAGWAMQFNHATDSSKLRVWTQGTTDKAMVAPTVSPLANLNAGWVKVDLVYDGATYYIYCNGTQSNTGTTYNSTPALQTGDFAFGGCAGSGYGSVNGWMDEVRLRKGAPTAAWVAADYATQNSDTFITMGAVIEIAEKPIPVVAASLIDSGAKYAQFEALAGNFGGEATTCAVQYKLWKTVEAEPAEWSVLIPSLTLNTAAQQTVTGLDPETAYSFKLKGVNELPNGETEVTSGAFTTGGTGDPGEGGDRYRVHNDYVHRYIIGTEDLTFVPPAYATSVTAMLVAGGGAGGYQQGGGGGAGGLLYTTLPVTPGETYTVHVGAGGVASTSADVRGGNGGDSTISHGEDVLLTAVGGGVGGNYKATPEDWTLTVGGNGGSGGGNGYFNKDTSLGSSYALAYNKHLGLGTSGQGFDGGAANVGRQAITTQNLDSGCKSAGGGGGAGKVGGDASEDSPCGAGSGGSGKAYDISGKTVYYAGGGAGGTAKVSGNSNVNTLASGGTGGGGDGGWGTTLPTAGVDGLGGGGGGGSGDAGYYQGANGGSGCVYIRYTVEGTAEGSALPVGSLTAAEMTAVMTAKVSYRVAWAGAGNETCDVYAAYGTSPNALNGEALLASGVIGTGTGAFSLPAPNTLYYVRIRVKNAAGSSDSDDLYTLTTGDLNETVSSVLTVTEASVSEGSYNATLASTAAGTVYRLTGSTYFGDTTEGWIQTEVGAIAAGGEVDDVAPLAGVMYLRYALDKGDGTYEYTATVMVSALDTPALGEVALTLNAGTYARISGTVTSLGLATEGSVRCWIGVQDDIARMKAQDPLAVTEGAYELTVSNLTTEATYYYYVEVVNANGSSVSSAVGSFTTVGASSIASTSSSASQRSLTFSGTLATPLGAGQTYVILTIDGVEYVFGPYDVFSEDLTFSQTVTAPSFDQDLSCTYLVSNAVGEVYWTNSGTARSASPVDNGIYTWKADDDGVWSGDWTDASHWTCNLEDNVGYPNSATASATFANCTAENPVTVTLTQDIAVKDLTLHGTSASDVTVTGGETKRMIVCATVAPVKVSGVTITLDNTRLALTTVNYNWPRVAVSLENNRAQDITLRFRNHAEISYSDDAHLPTADFVLANAGCRCELTGGSCLSLSGKFCMGGNDTSLLVDDSTLEAQFILFPDFVNSTNFVVDVKGAAPCLRVTATDSGTKGFFGMNECTSDATIRLHVPEGGWTEAPIQTMSTLYSFGDRYIGGGITGSSPSKFIFEVAPDSPFLASTEAVTNTMPIVSAAKGVNTNYVSAVDVEDGEFSYDDEEDPKTLYLTLAVDGPEAPGVPTDEEGNAVGEVVDGVAVIDVARAGDGMVIIIPNGVTQISLKVRDGEDDLTLTGYYTTASLEVADGRITPVLDASVVRPAFAESAEGAADAIEVGSDTVTLTSTAKPGLVYQLLKSETVSGQYVSVEGKKVRAGASATTVSFSLTKGDGESAAFYKVQVSDR